MKLEMSKILSDLTVSVEALKKVAYQGQDHVASNLHSRMIDDLADIRNEFDKYETEGLSEIAELRQKLQVVTNDAIYRERYERLLAAIQLASPAALAAFLSLEEKSALSRGAKIEAIKLVRSRLGLGIKEAKDLIESAMKDISPLPVVWQAEDGEEK